MKYLLILLLASCATAKTTTDTVCPVNKNGRHVADYMEKCNYAGCGSYCKCKAFRDHVTGIWFDSKDDAMKYLKKHKLLNSYGK